MLRVGLFIGFLLSKQTQGEQIIATAFYPLGECPEETEGGSYGIIYTRSKTFSDCIPTRCFDSGGFSFKRRCTENVGIHAVETMGTKDFALIETFESSCEGFKTAYAVTVDQQCYSAGFIRMRAIMNDDDSVTFNTYLDAKCETPLNVGVTVPGNDINTGRCVNDNIRLSIIPANPNDRPTRAYTHKFSSVVFRTNDNCESQPTAIIYTPSLGGVINCEPTDCGVIEGVAFQRGCVDEVADDVAGLMQSSNYLLVETFDQGCEVLQSAYAVAADGSCYNAGVMSMKAIFYDDGSVTFNTYIDQECTKPIGTGVNVPADIINSGTCYESSIRVTMKIQFPSDKPSSVKKFKATSTVFYENGYCNGASTAVMYTSNYDGLLTCTPTDCEAAGGVSFKRRCVNDIKSDAIKLMPRTNFLFVETLENDCSDLKTAYAFAIDGRCHQAGTISMQAFSSNDDSITFKTYIDAKCETPLNAGVTVPGNDINTGRCVNDNIRLSIITAKPKDRPTRAHTHKFSSMVFRTNDNCESQPTAIIYTPSLDGMMNCEATDCGVLEGMAFQRGCVDEVTDDVAGLMQSSDYLLVETFDQGCEVLQSAYAVAPDGSCYNAGVMSMKAIFHNDGSVTFNTYIDQECTKPIGTGVNVPADTINSGTCYESSIRVSSGNPKASVDGDFSSTQVPTSSSSPPKPSLPKSGAPTLVPNATPSTSSLSPASTSPPPVATTPAPSRTSAAMVANGRISFFFLLFVCIFFF